MLSSNVADVIKVYWHGKEQERLKDIEIYINNTQDPFFNQIIATETDQENLVVEKHQDTNKESQHFP